MTTPFSSTPINLGAPAAAVRLFLGYRAASLVEQPVDTPEEKAAKRSRFFSELGSTFMPGTPLMQAPIGLSAYIPAVIDPPSGSDLPDEVAAIVYASRPVYDYFRQNSLSRRMYTHSHASVFDMPKSVAQFPASLDAPMTVQANGHQHSFTFLFPDKIVDWQYGAIRVLLIVPAVRGAAFCNELVERLRAAPTAAETAGVNQILMAVAEGFAAIWIHAVHAPEGLAKALNILPEGCQVLRDLVAQPASVIGDGEQGVVISGPAAFTFRFERRMDLFR